MEPFTAVDGITMDNWPSAIAQAIINQAI